MAKILLISFCTLYSFISMGAQFGPLFPTHRFPTDKTLHLGYLFDYSFTNSNFDGSSHTFLSNDSTIVRHRHRLHLEYQANRQFNFGAYIHLDALTLDDPSQNKVSSSSLSDQYVFFEYRFYDAIGASLGISPMVKFPLYKNPEPIGTQNEIFFGDSQIDIALILTGEYWFNRSIRTRLNLGLNYRTEGYATEIPYLVSLAYVSHKLDLSLRLIGNMSLSNDDFDPSLITGQQNFAQSQYAFAQNPSVITINPYIEFWVLPSWALQLEYHYALTGDNSSRYQLTRAGVIYRWAKTIRKKKKEKFKEVDISTDQNKGKFEGEE